MLASSFIALSLHNMSRMLPWARLASALFVILIIHSPMLRGQVLDECTDRWCNWDYYSASTDPDRANTLRNEEKLHLNYGIQQMRERRYGAAFPEFIHILRVFPNHPVALDRLSQLCELWKDPKCAGSLGDRFTRAIAVNPNAASTYEVIGISQLRYKQPKLAVESCKKALELNPNSVNAHYTLGLAYFELKQYSLANEHAQQAYELGAPLPGLRDKLRNAGQWKPGSTAATAAPAPASEPEKPQAAK
jgi:tetratricopeptide (TPR) repeat protein